MWKLDDTMRLAQHGERSKTDLNRLAFEVFQKHSDLISGDRSVLRMHLIEKVEQYYRIGFRERGHLSALLTWEVFLGPDFLETYSEGDVKKMIYGSKTAPEAMDRLKAFLRNNTQ